MVIMVIFEKLFVTFYSGTIINPPASEAKQEGINFNKVKNFRPPVYGRQNVCVSVCVCVCVCFVLNYFLNQMSDCPQNFFVASTKNEYGVKRILAQSG
jgi:hypothetical protein